MFREQSLIEALNKYKASIDKASLSNVAIEHSPSDGPVLKQEKGEKQLRIVMIN